VIPWWERHVALVAYSPLGPGHFPGPRAKGGRLHAKIAAAHGATPRQVALRFLVQRQSVFAIPKSATPSIPPRTRGPGTCV
jgi:diketogulonate reductase-like aldo/keto reductase